MKHRHLMVDCETLSLRANAALLSIGAVVFDLEGRPGSAEQGPLRFYRVIQGDDYEQQVKWGRSVDLNVVEWWRSRPAEDQKEVFDNPYAVSLPVALAAFYHFCTNIEVDTIWSLGANADIVWLNDAFQVFGLPFPFHYRRQLCLRTLAELAGVERPKAHSHHALDDAIAQATWAQLCYAELQKGRI
jgi:hypothetical protein